MEGGKRFLLVCLPALFYLGVFADHNSDWPRNGTVLCRAGRTPDSAMEASAVLSGRRGRKMRPLVEEVVVRGGVTQSLNAIPPLLLIRGYRITGHARKDEKALYRTFSLVCRETSHVIQCAPFLLGLF